MHKSGIPSDEHATVGGGMILVVVGSVAALTVFFMFG